MHDTRARNCRRKSTAEIGSAFWLVCHENLALVFHCTRFWHQLERCSIPSENLACTWLKCMMTLLLVMFTFLFTFQIYILIHFISRMLSLQLSAATWQLDRQRNEDEPGHHQKNSFADRIPRCEALSVPRHTDIYPRWPCAICEG